MITDDVDGILIDSDEDGFHLIVSGLEAEYNFRLGQHGAVELLKAVQRDIAPWYAEGQRVLSEMTARMQENTYDLLDPKHPRHHEVMSDIWDSREGK